MKKLMLSAALFLALSTSLLAFVPQINFFVSGEMATARIFNHSGYPLVCSGVAFGLTYNRVVLNSWFNRIYIHPGMFADAYVYSNYYDPFISSWAQVDCQFAWN